MSAGDSQGEFPRICDAWFKGVGGVFWSTSSNRSNLCREGKVATSLPEVTQSRAMAQSHISQNEVQVSLHVPMMGDRPLGRAREMSSRSYMMSLSHEGGCISRAHYELLQIGKVRRAQLNAG
ncbi:hypothetical protein CLAIMM_09217 [Cladophialophora immunda]|nr:hypothetical protein CLAIMM_09217 [Cladophialophora immunda]